MGQLDPSQPKNDAKLKIVSFFLEFQILTSLEIGTRRGGDEVAVWDLPFSFGFLLERLGMQYYYYWSPSLTKKLFFLEMIRVD